MGREGVEEVCGYAAQSYKAGKDKQKIATAFNNATKSDQQWVKWQIRKERYGNSNNNYQWKK